jgi:hypothetical protein
MGVFLAKMRFLRLNAEKSRRFPESQKMDTKIIDNKPLLSSDALTALGADFNLRTATWADLNAVAQLIYDVCEADGDITVAVTPEELKVDWQSPGFNVETDTWIFETKDGSIVGYEEFIMPTPMLLYGPMAMFILISRETASERYCCA